MKVVRACFVSSLSIFLIVGCSSQPSNRSAETGTTTGESSSTKARQRTDGGTGVRGRFGDINRHGGKVVKTSNHFFEVVFDDKTVRLYAYDTSDNRVSLNGALARIQVQRGSEVSESIWLRFHPEEFKHEETPDEGYLQGHGLPLEDLTATQSILVFHVTGVPGTDKHINFTVPMKGFESSK